MEIENNPILINLIYLFSSNELMFISCLKG